MDIEIVKKGIWLYDGAIEKPVDIIRFDYDWWYEMAKSEGTLETDEEPIPIGEKGYIYYVRFQRAQETEGPTWVDSYGDQTIEQSIKTAEEKVSGDIVWQT